MQKHPLQNQPSSPLEGHTSGLTCKGRLQTLTRIQSVPPPPLFKGPSSLRPQPIPAVMTYPSKRSDPPTNLFLKHFIWRLHIKPYHFLTPFFLLISYLFIHVMFCQLLVKSILFHWIFPRSLCLNLSRLCFKHRFHSFHGTGTVAFSLILHVAHQVEKLLLFWF